MTSLILVRDGRTIAEETELAGTWGARLRGLMGRKDLPHGRALMLHPAGRIHTCGMRFPIDVVICDRHLRVLHVVSSLRPYRLTRRVRRSHCVFELHAGAAGGIVPGDQLALVTGASGIGARSR